MWFNFDIKMFNFYILLKDIYLSLQHNNYKI